MIAAALNRYHAFAASVINADHRWVGSMLFVRIGRLNLTFSLSSKPYRPIRRTRKA